jgi:xylulokinase
MQYFLGYDFGSSSVKASLTDKYGQLISSAAYPPREMPIHSPKPGFAEQDPEMWWTCCRKVTHLLLKKANITPDKIKSIGISYQMHGLVLIDKNGKVLRPAIIWCDSRAVSAGMNSIPFVGEYTMANCLNYPGNFTASKMRWVIENEPQIYDKIYKLMLPGDYMAYKMTGNINTTIAGLSEGIMWDFKKHDLAEDLLDHYGIPQDFIPSLVPVFGIQGNLSNEAASALGLKAGTPIAYRAGDQPNNAMSLNVLKPGEIAATGGTSGVVYAISDQLTGDIQQRVNSFAHVNHAKENNSIGILLCINGAGILYSWMRSLTGASQNYTAMEKKADQVNPGSDGISILPFGNGAERLLGNNSTGAEISGLDFNRHNKAHLIRAALEGIAFTFVYGIKSMHSLGVQTSHIRVGNDNLFQSAIFANTIAQLMNCRIEMMETNGATGAATGGQFGAGYCDSLEQVLASLKLLQVYEPSNNNTDLETSYQRWLEKLNRYLL